MDKTKTHYEQVPLAQVRKIARQTPGSLRTFPCAICGTSVELENCKIDECGAAVHGKCYIEKVATRHARANLDRAQDSKSIAQRGTIPFSRTP